MIDTLATRMDDFTFSVLVLGVAAAGLLLFLLFYRIPRSVLVVYLLVFPVQWLYIPVGTFNLRGDDGIAVIGTVALLLRFGVRPFFQRSPAFARLMGVLFVLQAYRYVSLGQSLVAGGVNWYETLQGVHSLCQLYIFVTIVRTEDDLAWLSRWYYLIVLGLVLVSLPALQANPFAEDVNRYALKRALVEGQGGRFNPNTYGIMASLILMMGYFQVYRYGRAWYIPGMVVALGVLAYFFFRTPLYVSLMVIGFCVATDAAERPIQTTLLLGLMGLIVLVTASDRFAQYYTNYVTNLNPTDIGLRREAAQLGLTIFKENVLLGVGLGRSHAMVVLRSEGALGSIHNSYLYSLAEHGLVGSFMLLILFGGMLKRFGEWMFAERAGRFWFAFFIAFLIRINFGPDLWLSKFTMQHFAIACAALGVYLDRTAAARVPKPATRGERGRAPGQTFETT